MKIIKVGIIGCGQMAQKTHIPNVVGIPGVEVKAIADLEKSKLDTVSNKYNIERTFTDYIKMLESVELDAVLVLTPAKTHAEISIEALRRKIHVFVEKPIATSVKEAERMIEEAEKNKVKLMVAHQSRFLPNHIRAKKIIQRGEIGDVVGIEMHSETLIIKPEEGALLDYSVHLIDLILYYLDKIKIERVFGVKHTLPGYKEDTSCSFLLQFKNGVLGRITVYWMSGWKSWDAVERYVKIIGTKGKIITDWSGPTLSIYKDGSVISRVMGLHKVMPEFAINKNIPFSDLAYKKELESFIKCIKEDTPPEVDGHHGKRVLEVVEAVRSSFEKEMEVKI